MWAGQAREPVAASPSLFYYDNHASSGLRILETLLPPKFLPFSPFHHSIDLLKSACLAYLLAVFLSLLSSLSKATSIFPPPPNSPRGRQPSSLIFVAGERSSASHHHFPKTHPTLGAHLPRRRAPTTLYQELIAHKFDGCASLSDSSTPLESSRPFSGSTKKNPSPAHFAHVCESQILQAGP